MSLGWQDSLAYRFNAIVWILYAILPPLTLMLVWLAAYSSDAQTQIGGYNLPQMISYCLFVTALSVMITPNMEWEISQLIRDGNITPFIVRPIGFFGHKVAQETSYQIIKSVMALPALRVLPWVFRDYFTFTFPFCPFARCVFRTFRFAGFRAFDAIEVSAGNYRILAI